MKQTSIIMISSVALLFCTACTAQIAAKAKPAVPVTVAQVLQRDVPVQIKAIGNIEAFTSVAIKSQVSAQIARVHFQEGSDVQKGALLISLDPEPFLATLSQCEAALAKDQAQEKFSREQAQRYAGLLKEGIVTRDQYDLLRATAESFAATVASDRAAIKSARIQLGYCSIRSPISGRTGTIAVQTGNLIKANDLQIVTVNQLSPIYATFSIPEKLLNEVKRAMAGNELKIEVVIPNEPGSTEAGTISFLDNTVNPATGMIKLKGVFANKSRKLWPGQFTDVVMTLGNRINAVVVPTNAIQTSQQGQFIYVVKPDNSVEMRQVTVAMVVGEDTVVEKGLGVGETVVIDGQLRLTPGAVVESKEKQAAVKQPAEGKN
jgi:multidrug efflux system membrane fusion protein